MNTKNISPAALLLSSSVASHSSTAVVTWATGSEVTFHAATNYIGVVGF